MATGMPVREQYGVSGTSGITQLRLLQRWPGQVLCGRGRYGGAAKEGSAGHKRIPGTTRQLCHRRIGGATSPSDTVSCNGGTPGITTVEGRVCGGLFPGKRYAAHVLVCQGFGYMQELGLQLQLEPANPAAPGAPVAAPTLTVTEAPQPGDATSADTPEATDGGGDGDDTPRQDGAGLVTPNATSDSITNVPSDNGTNWAAVGGGVAAAAIILLLLLCIICFLVIRLRRRGKNGDTVGHGVGGTDIAQPPGLPACASGPPGPSKHGRSEELSTAATLHAMATPGHQVAPTQGVMNHDMDEGYFAPMPDQISAPPNVYGTRSRRCWRTPWVV